MHKIISFKSILQKNTTKKIQAKVHQVVFGTLSNT